MLNHFKFSDLRSVVTSMKQDLDLKASENCADVSFIKQYQSAVKFLMYAMTQTHLNIAYSISVLSQFSHNLNIMH